MIWIVRDGNGVVVRWYNNEAQASRVATAWGRGAYTEGLDESRYAVALAPDRQSFEVVTFSDPRLAQDEGVIYREGEADG